MSLHDSTFEYLLPTDDQKQAMGRCREAAKNYAAVLADELPDGPDKTHVLRKLRELAMWSNVSITRHADGSPRV